MSRGVKFPNIHVSFSPSVHMSAVLLLIFGFVLYLYITMRLLMVQSLFSNCDLFGICCPMYVFALGMNFYQNYTVTIIFFRHLFPTI